MNLRSSKIPPLYVLCVELEYYYKQQDALRFLDNVTKEQRQLVQAEIVYRKDIYRFIKGVEYERAVAIPERDTLVELFLQWNGFGWAHNDGWIGLPRNTTRPQIPPFTSSPRIWSCVLIENDRVVALALRANRCIGPMFRSWGVLGQLLTLDISQNQISGQLPESLSTLTSLQVLNLSQNQLQGPIPNGMLLPLARLKTMDLSFNQLSGGLPNDFTNMKMLTTLNLAGNQFTGALPFSMCHLTRLRDLVLYNNMITGPLPQWLTELARLNKLNLSMNPLTGPMDIIANLTKLTFVALSECSLQGSSGRIPSDISKLRRLELLHLQHNSLSGELPAELGDLSALEFLNLQDNSLQGLVPGSIGKLTNLKSLVLSGNYITAPFPRSLSQLHQLSDFHICHWWPSEHHEIPRGFVCEAFRRVHEVLPTNGIDNLGPLPVSEEAVDALLKRLNEKEDSSKRVYNRNRV